MSSFEDGDEVHGAVAGGTMPYSRLKDAQKRWLNDRRPPVASALTRVLGVLALGITAALFLILNRPFYAAAIGHDEGFVVWGGWCITKGLTPYHDFVGLEPPMAYITHALALALFGLGNQGFRIFFAALP